MVVTQGPWVTSRWPCEERHTHLPLSARGSHTPFCSLQSTGGASCLWRQDGDGLGALLLVQLTCQEDRKGLLGPGKVVLPNKTATYSSGRVSSPLALAGGCSLIF